MPTGYTADLCDGKDVSFEGFALNCARAFGALVSLRDEPDAEIPDEFKVDEYYVKKFEEAKEELEKVKSMTDEELAEDAKQFYEYEKAHFTTLINDAVATRKRYENMLEQVEQWEPPTEKHIELKKFMIDQLNESIRFDTSTSYYEEALAKLSLETVEEARKNRLKVYEDNFNYRKTQLEEQKGIMKDRTEWVSELRKSLKK